jgi:hypothetical protein
VPSAQIYVREKILSIKSAHPFQPLFLNRFEERLTNLNENYIFCISREEGKREVSSMPV